MTYLFNEFSNFIIYVISSFSVMTFKILGEDAKSAEVFNNIPRIFWHFPLKLIIDNCI